MDRHYLLFILLLFQLSTGTLDDRENLTESCHYSNNGSCYPSYDFRWLGEEAFTRLLPDYIFGSVIQPLYA